MILSFLSFISLTASAAVVGHLPNGLSMHYQKLGNGLQVYIVENHDAPVFTYQVWFRVGAKDEKLDKRLDVTGLAHLFEHMMFRGTKSVPDGEFDRILARNGVNDGSATTWLDRTNYYESMPSRHLELVIRLEADRMANLVINKKLLDTEREAVLGEYRMCKDDPVHVANEKLFSAAFAVHPYRYPTLGSEEEIRRFSKADADYFYKTYYAPNNAAVVIVGDVDPEKAFKLVKKHYGPFKAQRLPLRKAPAEPPQTAERKVEFGHPRLMQSRLFLGYHIPAAVHADIPALMIAHAMLTLGEGSVLNRNWVNAGLSVSAGGAVHRLKDPGLFVLTADVQEGGVPERLVPVLDTWLVTLSGKNIAKEVERARNQLLLGMYKQWSGNDTLAAFMGEHVVTASTPMFAFQTAAAVEKVSGADVQRVIKKYLVPANRTVVVAGPEKVQK
ncbi:MAG: hypothetical protein A2583_07725 [Bdellovibrionales bacterium RIFOXYD1_FULL_53_11]|nr:MAG: hypothetical protein A2583_07725 [Bdellovibrionales bacterium RIFOXYD1_FULL_53_11]